MGRIDIQVDLKNGSNRYTGRPQNGSNRYTGRPQKMGQIDIQVDLKKWVG